MHAETEFTAMKCMPRVAMKHYVLESNYQCWLAKEKMVRKTTNLHHTLL